MPGIFRKTKTNEATGVVRSGFNVLPLIFNVESIRNGSHIR